MKVMLLKSQKAILVITKKKKRKKNYGKHGNVSHY